MKRILFLASILFCGQAALADIQGPALHDEESSASTSNDAIRPVFIKTYDYYAPNGQVWTSVRVKATNVVSAEVFVQAPKIEPSIYPIVKDLGLESAMFGSNGVIFIKPGRYIVSGRSGFCFVKEQGVTISEETASIDLFIGCH